MHGKEMSTRDTRDCSPSLRLRLRRPCRGLPTRRDERRQRPKYMTQGIAPWRDKATKDPSKFPARVRSTHNALSISDVDIERKRRETGMESNTDDAFLGIVNAIVNLWLLLTEKIFTCIDKCDVIN